MPVSDNENKKVVVDWFRQISPDVVVDIGPGEGTYVKLLDNENSTAVWYGIEAWGPYVNQYSLRDWYDRIIISDVRHVDLESVHLSPDLVIAGDVLEHMAKEEAQQVIRNLQAWAPQLIIAVPLAHHAQGPYEGNWFECHQDQWTHQEMLEFLGLGVCEYVEGRVLGYYWWSLTHAASQVINGVD